MGSGGGGGGVKEWEERREERLWSDVKYVNFLKKKKKNISPLQLIGKRIKSSTG